MHRPPTLIANAINNFDEFGEHVQVSAAHGLIELVSEQLYQSPLKAIEELVVNAYDADASECRVYVPLASDPSQNFAVVFDDGIGMDYDGLVDLWKIGRSNKRMEEIESKRERKQIGKFGIGKLAAHAIANRLTYVTQNDQGKILSLTMDFKRFSSSDTWESDPIRLPVRYINDWDKFSNDSYISEILQQAGVNPKMLPKTKSWTIAILEDLKDKARKIKAGRLRSVLSTAMPLRISFRLYLNGQEVQSSKEDLAAVVTFDLKDLPEERLKALQNSTGENWIIQGENLKSDSFESGITGTVKVTKKTLYGGKSDDLIRSHGFFILVRERLINEDDPLFGVPPMTYEIFNRIRAEIKADDLDEGLKASRETVEESSRKTHFQDLLREIFNEATSRYARWKKDNEPPQDQPEEGKKEIFAPREIEHPTANVLTDRKTDPQGTEADDKFFYVEEIDTSTREFNELIQSLYTTNSRQEFHYEYRGAGHSERLVKFNPQTSTFWLNQDHELVLEYANDEPSKRLLQDFVTAEALLEIYLRDNKLPAHVVGSVLEKRDGLLRKLIREETYANLAIAQFLRDAATDANGLEHRIVGAVRALGFVANRVSGPGEPDGIAMLVQYPGGEKKITLEAKSSDGIPTLSSLDFAGLQSHMEQKGANGCLLVAPAYPGQSKEDNEVARRAQSLKISCWTVEQFAKFVEDAEARQFHAADLLNIVLHHFSPHEVTTKLEEISSRPSKNRSLYWTILESLRDLEKRITDEPFTVGMMRIEVSRHDGFTRTTRDEIRDAIRDLSGMTNGAILLKAEEVLVNVSLNRLEQRLSSLIK